MRMSSTYGHTPVANNFQANTVTAGSLIVPELPALPKGGLVSSQFSGYLGRDPDNQPGGVNSVDLDGVQTPTYTAGPEMSQALGRPEGGFVFDHFNSFLGRTPDAGAPTMQDFHFTMQDFASEPAVGLAGQSTMQDFHFRFVGEEIPDLFEARAFANADASHMDVLPAVQALLPAVQVNALPAVQTDLLPAVQALLPAVQLGALPAVQADLLPTVQTFLPAVQTDALPAVQTDILPAVQVFASDWLWV